MTGCCDSCRGRAGGPYRGNQRARRRCSGRPVASPDEGARIRRLAVRGQDHPDRWDSSPADRGSPWFTVVAAGIRGDREGPVCFGQARIGQVARRSLLTFRTMLVGAAAMFSLAAGPRCGSGALFTLRDDRRITPIGAGLRRYSPDELPALVNVLRAQISMVGPRPRLASEVETDEQDVRRRLLVRPAMTVLCQINRRGDPVLGPVGALRPLHRAEPVRHLRADHLWLSGRAFLRSSGARPSLTPVSPVGR